MDPYKAAFAQDTDARTLGDVIGDADVFMGLSAPYKYLAGIGEVAAFALLLHHRTALLGAVVTVAVMANVCALNWFYGVPVKLYSTHLLLIGGTALQNGINQHPH